VPPQSIVVDVEATPEANHLIVSAKTKFHVNGNRTSSVPMYQAEVDRLERDYFCLTFQQWSV
jgi:hypothetical protein